MNAPRSLADWRQEELLHSYNQNCYMKPLAVELQFTLLQGTIPPENKWINKCLEETFQPEKQRFGCTKYYLNVF